MSKYCTSCGKPVLEDDLFCSNCGAKQRRTSETVDYGSPQGKDWFAVIFAGISLLYLIAGVFRLNPIIGIIFMVVFFIKRNIIKQAVWRVNVFKPLTIHLVWGWIVCCAYAIPALLIFEKVSDPWSDLHYFVSEGTVYLFLMLCLVIFNGIHSLGCRFICSVYPASKPQANFARFLVSMGLILAYMLIRKKGDVFDSTFLDDGTTASNINDAGNIVAGGVSGSTVASIQPDTSMTGMSNAMDTSNIQDMTSTSGDINSSAGGDSTVNFTDAMSQPDGTAVVHSDGSVDLTDADMQYAGHITSGGQILDSLNLPDGRIDGTTIFDAQGQLAYTIEGDAIYDNMHQIAYTIREGNIFDKMNQLVGRIS